LLMSAIAMPAASVPGQSYDEKNPLFATAAPMMIGFPCGARVPADAESMPAENAAATAPAAIASSTIRLRDLPSWWCLDFRATHALLPWTCDSDGHKLLR